MQSKGNKNTLFHLINKNLKSDVEKGFDIQWFKQFRDALLNTVYSSDPPTSVKNVYGTYFAVFLG